MPATSGPGELALLDVTTGAVKSLGISNMASWGQTAAFSPDGNLLAVTVDNGVTPVEPRDAEEGTDQSVAIVDLAGAVKHTITLPRWHNLAGPAAWSPDGALLVAVEHIDDASTLTFLDATGEGRAVPPPRRLTGPSSDLLGWRSPASMLIGTGNGRDYRIVETPVRVGEPRTVSRLPQGIGRLARVGHMQLAGALLGAASITDAGGAERGPWPLWWRITLTAAILLAAWTLRHRLRDGWTAWRRSR